MCDSEIDDFDGVVRHHENVAGFQIAVHQPAFVGRLQAAAGLGHDFADALDRQAVTGTLDQALQSLTRQQGHDEIRFLQAVVFEFTDIEDLDDVGMAQAGEDITFLLKQLQSRRFGDLAQGLERNIAMDQDVVGAIDQAHATFSQHFLDLVPAS